MNSSDSTLRKAAILVTSVDRQTADLLLAALAEPAAAALRRAAVQLDAVAPAEREAVLAEFQQLAGSTMVDHPRHEVAGEPPPLSQRNDLVPRRRPAGIDLSDAPAEKADVPGNPSPDEGNSSFSEAPVGGIAPAKLHQADGDALAEFLFREHPQTIAVILARIRPAQAAEALRRLPSETQAAVVRRLSELDRADPRAIADIERRLQQWLAERSTLASRKTVGISAVARILEAAGLENQQAVLANLSRHDAELAARLTRLPSAGTHRVRSGSLTFVDLLQLDAPTLAAIVAAADRPLAVLALVGAPDDVFDRIRSHLPRGVAAELGEAMAHLGATRLSDVEKAQQRLADLALKMEAEARVDLAALRSLSVAA